MDWIKYGSTLSDGYALAVKLVSFWYGVHLASAQIKIFFVGIKWKYEEKKMKSMDTNGDCKQGQ